MTSVPFGRYGLPSPPPPLPLPGTHPLGYPPAKVPNGRPGRGTLMGGLGFLPLLAARHPCLAGSSLRKALRYGGEVVTVRGGSVHANRA
jgi:hypothetical protein